MLNQSTTDLESATVRMRFFGGRRAADVAEEMPILPVNAPGIPPPGASLALFAAAIGDEAPTQPLPPAKGRKKSAKVVKPDGPTLTAVVRSAVYQPGTTVVLTHNDKPLPREFVPGVTHDGLGPLRYGPSPCRLAVVGKCLGRAEAAERRPFCGPGSEPLWRAWGEAGLPDMGAALPTFLTNIVRFEPPPSAVAKLPSDWVRDGVHLLYHELAACRPEYVLLLGADALKAVFGAKAKVSDHKGREVELEVDCRPTLDAPEDRFVCRVVAADHPAAVSRDPDMYPSLLASMRFLARKMGLTASGPDAVPTDYRAVYSADELRAAVAESEAASAAGGYVSFDCEWEGRHPEEPGAYLYTVQWSHAPGHARVAYLRRCGGAENPSLPPDQAAALLRRLLCGAPARGARLVGHFAKADLPWLLAAGVDLYPHFVGPRDDPDPDGSAARQWAWQKCYYEGAFDTYIASHAVEEEQPRGLEVLTTSVLGLDRYDQPLNAWKESYCKEKKLKKSELGGYGNCPEEVITPYAARDCDDPGRLYLLYNGDPRVGTKGRLDRDRFGNSSRQIFATRMRAWAAVAEMERYGLEADVAVHRRSRDVIVAHRAGLLGALREKAGWPEFDPARRAHRVEFLFGEEYLDAGAERRPAGALSLYLEPYKSTKTAGGGRLWAESLVRCRRDGIDAKPAADKETLISLSRQHELAAALLDIDFLTTATKILFRVPDAVEEAADDDGEAVEVHGRGFAACIGHDGRVRTRIGHVETGRYSSSAPNMTNLGSAVDDRYNRILGWGEYAPEGSSDRGRSFVTRAIVRARPGWFIVAADLKGAEIAAAAWNSGDGTLTAHAARATLDESDPEWLDLHADLAASTFNLPGTLKEVKKKYKALRVGAKKTRFSHYYGASADTIYRQVLQETKDITPEQIEQLIAGHDEKYPVLAGYFAMVRARAMKEGWMCNGYGGYRRIRKATDPDLQAAQQRELQNWTAQGLVADNIAYALGNMWYALHDRKMRTRIVLSVHDSIMLECPPDEVDLVAKPGGLLERAMSDDNPVVVTSPDGTPLAWGPYRFGVDISVCRNWGIDLPESEWSFS